MIKAGGVREAFSEDKLRNGMLKALEKRPVEKREKHRKIRSQLKEISTEEEDEIKSTLIVERLMRE